MASTSSVAVAASDGEGGSTVGRYGAAYRYGAPYGWAKGDGDIDAAIRMKIRMMVTKGGDKDTGDGGVEGTEREGCSAKGAGRGRQGD